MNQSTKGNDKGNAQATQSDPKEKGETSQDEMVNHLAAKVAKANKFAEVLAARAKDKSEERVEEVPNNAVDYLACRQEHPGIFLAGVPKGKLSPLDWWSKDKAPGAPQHTSTIRCQVCGDLMPTLKTPDGGTLINRRFLRSLTKAQAAEMGVA